MTPPLIGICTGEKFIREPGVPGVLTTVSWKYYQAFQREGARVVMIPPVPDSGDVGWVFELLDGIVFAGGEDVCPSYQGEDPQPDLGNVNPLRDRAEVTLAREAWRRRFPMLGICRGCQLIAIALGGRVHQDLGAVARVQHTQRRPRWSTSHRVQIAADSRVAGWVGTVDFMTNSFHHQAVDRVPDGFAVRGRTGDGVVELIEAIEGPATVGVQWHPEETSPGDEISRRLFAGFVRACAEARSGTVAV